jgi:hypothetical protein
MLPQADRRLSIPFDGIEIMIIVAGVVIAVAIALTF